MGLGEKREGGNERDEARRSSPYVVYVLGALRIVEDIGRSEKKEKEKERGNNEECGRSREK